MQIMNELDALRMTSRSCVTRRGLVIGGEIQCFHWEREAQIRFAKIAAQASRTVVNIGYGLGFAHAAFEETPGLLVELVELNPSVMARARRQSTAPSTVFHLGSWAAVLPNIAASDKTIFFDAFPVDPNFDYSHDSFVSYMSPFLEAMEFIPSAGCFFVAFDCGPIRFPVPGRMCLKRVATAPLPASFRSRHVDTISLYELS
jgi:hypothetical protein